MKNKIVKIILPLFLFAFLGGTVHAQVTKINGIVTDEFGQPLRGVAITSSIGKNIAVSEYNGQYFLNIEDESDKVTFSLLGYQSEIVTLGTTDNIDVTLNVAETYNLDEPVYLGFTQQKRGAITGAVETVSGEELMKSPSANLSQTMVGHLAGLYTRETYNEPSRASTTLKVRGITSRFNNSPLLVVDGIPYSYNTNQIFEYISAAEVDQISILKDAASQAMYGIQGADGVIVITTKRGKQGKLNIDVKLDQTFEQLTSDYNQPGSPEYVLMRNQAFINNGLPAKFSPSDVENFISGENRELYPNNDWKKMNMKDITSMQRVNVNLTGGNEKARFFTNLNMMHQGDMWKTSEYAKDKYGSNAGNMFLWANFRSNVDVDFNEWISASLNLSGNIKRERIPGSTTANTQGFANNIWYRFFTTPPTMYGPLTPEVIDPESGEVLDPGGGIVVTNTEPYSAYSVLNHVGYINHTVTNIYALFTLDVNLGFITKGLSLKGTAGYQTNSVNSTYTQQTFAAWQRDPGTFDELIFNPYGTGVDSPLSYAKGSSFYYNLNFKGILDYQRTFGDHEVGATAYAFYQDLNTENNSSPNLLPYKRITSGLEATYAYDNRYFAKVNLSYSGSEQYAPENRFTALPAASIGWIATNEEFMEDVDWLTFLKIRASVGKTANDRTGLPRYAYLDNFKLNRGGSQGYLMYQVSEGQTANPEIKPEIVTKQNYGIDFTLLNNFSFSVDLFKERVENSVVGGTATTPLYQGIPLGNYPSVNTGIFENKGLEIAGDYTKVINKDLSFNVGGWFAHTTNKNIYSDESELAEDYAYRKISEGFPYGQQFGLIVDKTNGNGFFNSLQEIDDANLVYESGAPRVGDLKYFDLNNDGIINMKDVAPLGHGALPRFTYSFHAKLNYKNFDMSALFFGVADHWEHMMDTGRNEYSFEGVYSDWHKNAWTQERYENGEKITYPALSTARNANHDTNSFFMEDKSFLRLKNLEIGYTFPMAISKYIGANNLRVYLSGRNLFTWHNMTTDEIDPELTSHMTVPPYRLYNIGLSLKF